MPLGLALGWISRSVWPAVLCGFLLSTSVEIAQMVIPGRDPAINDILFNSIGAVAGGLLGSSRHVWLTGARARRETPALVALTLIMSWMTVTLVLLAPNGSIDLERVDDDLVLRYPTIAGTLGLDEPEYWISRAFQTGVGGQDQLVIRRQGNQWRISVGLREMSPVGPTVGQGWTLLAYPNEIGRRWNGALNAAWMLLMAGVVGFWSQRRLGLSLLGATALVAAQLVLPLLAGTRATPPGEWLGSLAGFLIGIALSRFAFARRSLPDVMSQRSG